MKKIAAIASYIHPIRQKHLLDWYKGINKEEIKIKLFIGSKNREIPFAENYKINSKKDKLKYAMLSVLKLKKLPKSLQKIQPLVYHNPDIIHLLTSNAFKNIEPFLKDTSVKLIVSFRGYDINVFPHKSEANKQLIQQIFQKADKLHFISEDLKDNAIDIGANPKKCVVIKRSIKVKKDGLNIKPKNKKLIILSVGRLVWEKGYLYALETIAYLKKKDYDFEYHIAGSGTDYNSLLFHIKRLNIQDKVFFLGELNREEVKNKMLEADIYFQPSVKEALSLALIEASYMRLPIVSSNIGGIPEVVENGVTGYLSVPCNPILYAENICKLIKNENLRKQMGKYGHERMLKHFSREEELKKWKVLYNSLH